MNSKNDSTATHHHHHHHSSHHHQHLPSTHHHHQNGLNGLIQTNSISNGINAKLYSLNQSNSSSNSMLNTYGQQASLLQNGGSNTNLLNSQNNPTNNNSNSNNSNTNLYDDSFNTFNSYINKNIQLPTWFDIEIKGMVKNISPKLWQWTHLKCLCLNDNNLVRLPPVVSNLTNLQYLDLSNNKIRTLPAEIGDMTSLRELYLNNNQLRVLPFELGKLFKLHQLGLKGNPLTSDIMSIYSEPNGTQKLLISLLDQLSITCTPPPRRPWMILGEPSPSLNPCIFTTMCYNVLCDKYATRQFYGYCPAWALNWEYRKKVILDDIKNFNADIITLQELETEQFHNYFLPELKQFDYDGIFSPKSRAKTMSEHDKKHVDGCAILFKTSRFQLVKDYLIEFNQIAMATAEGSEDMLNRVMTKDNIGLAALLEIKQDELSTSTAASQSDIISSKLGNNNNNKDQLSNGSLNGTQPNKQLLLVSTAHIHWDPDYCDVKLIQTLMLTNEIKLIIEQATREFLPHKLTSQQTVDCSTSIPVVICADLNSLPDSGVIEYLRTGRILANHVDFKDLGYETCLQKINTSDRPSELSHNLKLECAYDKDLMPYTNYTYDFKGMIDYIFFSRNLLRTVGLLGPLDMEWIKANKIVGFPHPHVPSDHLPLMVELELYSNNNNNNNQNNFLPSSHHSSFHSTSSSTSLNNRSNGNGTNNSQHSINNNGHHLSHHSHQNSNSNSQLSLGQMIPINTNGNTSNNNNSNSQSYNNYLRK